MSNNDSPTSNSRDRMLTTIDNPYNPFVQWDEWLRYDRDQGYYTNEYLARVAQTDESLSDEQNVEALDLAMEEIVNHNPTNLWVFAYRPSSK